MERAGQPGEPIEHVVEVPPEAAGERLDRFVASALGVSRSQVAERIAAGDVQVDGRAARKAGERLRARQRIAVRLPPPPPSVALPEAIPIAVVYEDEDLVVVDKPAGLVVHPGPGHPGGTLVNALLHRYALAPEREAPVEGPRPGIVHRLDRDTSGLLVVARTVRARDGLMAAIAAREVERRYVAMVWGAGLADCGTFDTLHGRHPRDRKRFTTRVAEGRRAVTHYEVVARAQSAALVACRLETGRTHQIRVHFADAGHPLVGDETYGRRRWAPPAERRALERIRRQALPAYRLRFRHPVTGEVVDVRSPLPADLRDPAEVLFGVEALAAFVAPQG